MNVRRAVLALISTATLCLAGQASAAAAPTGVTAATPGELLAICEDLFGDVYDTPSTEPLAACQWNMAIIDADASARANATGDGVRVGVIDSGIDATHPDIAPNLDLAASCSFIRPGTPTALPAEVATSSTASVSRVSLRRRLWWR
jgi:subtilisin family serine protease